MATNKVKKINEGNGRKVDQYQKLYEEMHVRALTAELEASNLQLKLDETKRRLNSEHGFTLLLIDEVTQLKSTQTSQSDLVKKVQENMNNLKEKLKKEFDKINTNQKDMRIGINSLMRCVFEFKTGVISQNDFFAAVELIFSSLENNDKKLLSPSPSNSSTGTDESHLETCFNRHSLQELSSLPRQKRREKLQQILDHLSPDCLFKNESEQFPFHLFESSLNTLNSPSPSPPPPPPPPPSLPLRNKPKYLRSKTSPQLPTPPPIPPRSILPPVRKQNGGSNNRNYNNKSFTPPSALPEKQNGRQTIKESDSDSDFEEIDDNIRKTRRKRISSESLVTTLAARNFSENRTLENTKEKNGDAFIYKSPERNGGSVHFLRDSSDSLTNKESSVKNGKLTRDDFLDSSCEKETGEKRNKTKIKTRKHHKKSMKRWKSCDQLLQSNEIDNNDSSDNSGCYSLPFQHVQAWRNLIGIRDSSIMTGSLPRLHSITSPSEIESLYYITPNEFRNMVAQVRKESVKISGNKTTEKVIKRVDSIIRTRGHSKTYSQLGENEGGYISLLGDPSLSSPSSSSSSSWLQKIQNKKDEESLKKRPPLTPPPRSKMKISYENHTLPIKAQSPAKEISPKDSPVGRTFDDPLYGCTYNNNSIYHDSYSPSPPPPPLPPSNNIATTTSTSFTSTRNNVTNSQLASSNYCPSNVGSHFSKTGSYSSSNLGRGHSTKSGNHSINTENHLSQSGNHLSQSGNHLSQSGNHLSQSGNHSTSNVLTKGHSTATNTSVINKVHVSSPTPSPRSHQSSPRAPSLPPRPPPPKYKQDSFGESTEISKRTHSSPVLPPKHHNKVNIEIRDTKPVPKPRIKKDSVQNKSISSNDNHNKVSSTGLADSSSANSSHTVSSSRDISGSGSTGDPLLSSIPAYFSLKRGTHSLQLIPQFFDSDSEEDDISAYSLGRFEFVENNSTVKQEKIDNNTSENSIDSEESSDEYEIPPDAALGYIEPSSYTTGSDKGSSVSGDITTSGCTSDRKYTTTLSNVETNVIAEKQGYLHKLDPSLKHWTRRWFVLKGKELKYYSKKGAANSRAKGVINLAAWCKVTRHELTSSFQLATPLRTYHFVADSNSECEDWIKALQTVMRMCQVNLTSHGSTKDIPADWARVKLSSWSQCHQKMWIALIDQSLLLYADPNADSQYTFSLVDALVRHSTDTPNFLVRSSSQIKEEFTIIVELGGASNSRSLSPIENEIISLCYSNKMEKDKWFYHLVSTASGETGPEITLTEKIVARLWRADTSTAPSLWSHPVLNYTTEPLQEPLVSLPSSELANEALQLFKSVHLFITTPFDPLALDYHIVSFQQLISKCMTEPFLHDELYCQVLRQISSPTTSQDHQIILQSWFLLALLLPHLLPKRKLFIWYLKTFLTHQQGQLGSQPTIVAQLANLCEQRCARMEKNGLREKKPSWYELYGLMCRPVHLTCVMQMRCPIPINLLNDTSLTIDCDSCSTVQEVISQLNQEIGMQDTFTTGFALMSDWPGEEDIDVFFLFPNSKLMDVVSMWSDSLTELGNSSSSHARTIHLTYRNRLSFRARRGQETDKEVVLLAYQHSKDVFSDHILIPTLDIALDVAARMAQIDYGNCASIPNAEVIAKDALRRFCCRRYTVNTLPHDIDLLASRLLHKWQGYHNLTPQICSRMLLNLLQDIWEFFGSTLFFCKDMYGILVQKNASVWLAVNEDGVSLLNGSSMKELVSFSYKEIATFGGHGDDFMLVVNSRYTEQVSSTVQTEKIVLSMPKFKIREATYLMASYLDY